jgi:hypothetical protein
MRRLSAIVRGLMSNELVASDIRTKHRQLVRMIWTRNGMGERYHRALGTDLPYDKFEARVTDLLCQGAEAGWVRIVIPPSPLSDESEYRLEFEDDERFVEELEALFVPKPTGT